MPLDDRARILHMRDAAVKAIGFLEGMSRTQLEDDAVETYAVARLLEIVGEAAKAVSAEIRHAYPSIPWNEVSRLRDRLAHGYFDVDHDIIWDVVKSDLPELITSLDSLIRLEHY